MPVTLDEIQAALKQNPDGSSPTAIAGPQASGLTLDQGLSAIGSGVGTIASGLIANGGVNRAAGTIAQGTQAAGAGIDAAALASQRRMQQAANQRQRLYDNGVSGVNSAATSAQDALTAANTERRGIYGQGLQDTTDASGVATGEQRRAQTTNDTQYAQGRADVLAARDAGISAENGALAQEKDIYGNVLEGNKDYAQTGKISNEELQKLIQNYQQFDPKSVLDDPSYKFEQDQTTKATQAAQRFQGNLNTGPGAVALAQRIADYGTTKAGEIQARNLAEKQNQQNLVLSGVGVGERAQGRNQDAGNVYGSQIGHNADAVSDLGTHAADENLAAGQTYANATQNNANNVGNIATDAAAKRVSQGQQFSGALDQYASNYGKVGTDAAATNQAAGANQGAAVDQEAGAESAVDTDAARQKAELAQNAAEANAAAQVTTAKNTAGTVAGVTNTALGALDKYLPSVLGKAGKAAAPLASIAPGLASIGGGAAAAGTAATAIPGGAAAAAASAAPAAGGGFGASLAALATNPITIGIAGALGAGAVIIKKLQSHGTADKVVQDVENPYVNQTLAPAVDAWDKAVQSGQMTQQQGEQAADAFGQSFTDYVDGLTKWAGDDKKKKLVAMQSISNLWAGGSGFSVRDKLAQMHQQIAAMPA